MNVKGSSELVVGKKGKSKYFGYKINSKSRNESCQQEANIPDHAKSWLSSCAFSGNECFSFVKCQHISRLELYYAGNGIWVDINFQEFFKNSRSLINNCKANKSTVKETFKFNTRSYLMPLGGILTHNINVRASAKHIKVQLLSGCF